MKKLLLLLTLIVISFTGFCQVITLKKHYYTIYFHEKQKAPLYTVYTLKKEYIVQKDRQGNFKQDTAVATDDQANNNTYDDPGYDKGHLTPDADFRFSRDAENETFLYTNAAPQQDYFNEHLWANLEAHVRTVCKEYGDVKVYTGCLYSNKKLHGVGIPAIFWKVIIYKKHDQKITEAYKAKNIKPVNNIYTSITDSLGDIEKLSGLKFR